MRRDRDLEAAERRIEAEYDHALQAASRRQTDALQTASEKLQYAEGLARDIQRGEMQAANEERKKRHARAHDDYRHASAWAYSVWEDEKRAAVKAYEVECAQAEQNRDEDAAVSQSAYTSMSDQEAPEGAMAGPSEEDASCIQRLHAARVECLDSILRSLGWSRGGGYSEDVAQAFDAYDLTRLESIYKALLGEGVTLYSYSSVKVDESNG